MNVILGGGNAGKTTVLDAVALLLSPSTSVQVTDDDFWQRNTTAGFVIEGVFWFPDGSEVWDAFRKTPWPWIWDGSGAVLPDPNETKADPDSEIAVLVLRVCANEDFEVSWEIVHPNGECEHLSVAVRRRIGRVWLEGDDRNDRDLRLVYGSALERYLGDPALKSRLAQSLSDVDIESTLLSDAQSNLSQLDQAFFENALPSSLNVGLVSSRSVSLAALVGLTAMEGRTRLPLTSWGAGTRRLSALQITAANQSGSPVTIVDEIERGLEPHRQRVLMRRLLDSSHQTFVTTHSPTIVAAAREGDLWFMDAARRIGPIVGRSSKHARVDPEAFLAKLTIVAEGKTEVEFVEYLLDLTLDGLRLEYGIWTTDGGGNDNALELLEGLVDARIQVGGFVDYEGRFQGRWNQLRQRTGELVLQWEEGCLEENVIPLVPLDRLEEFVEDPSGDLTGMRLRVLQDRLRATDKAWATLSSGTHDLHRVIAEAASGFVPGGIPKDERKTYKNHGRSWFKRDGGGTELARKCAAYGILRELTQLLPFVNAVREAVDLPPLQDMPC